MLKILSAQQTKELDAYTIAHEPVPSIDLMERACKAFVKWFTPRFDTSKKIGVVCGTGNNGGDGLGIARLLTNVGYQVSVWIVRGTSSESSDFKTNLERIRSKIEIQEITPSADKSLFPGIHVLIDAIFGSGLSRPLEGIYEQVVGCINQSDVIRVAVDIPSGLLTDKVPEGVAVKAHYTVSFHLPKLTFFLSESYQYTGDWFIVNIGLSKTFVDGADSSYFFLEGKDIDGMLMHRQKFSHKGTYGKALIISGSYGKIGAAVLASRAAMRSGLGLLTVHAPHCGYDILQTTVPEAMVSVDDHEEIFSNPPSLDAYDAFGVGPGIGTERETVKAFGQFLERIEKPVVIDADGLNILSAHRELLNLVPPHSILTPHPKEFERLAGTSKNDLDRLNNLKKFAVQTRTVIILKGAYSAIAIPDGNIYFNSTGNPGMATGGSGDVLTGLLTGLLAQQYAPATAALLGVYIHGLAGDYAMKKKGVNAMIASDIIEGFSKAFKSFGR